MKQSEIKNLSLESLQDKLIQYKKEYSDLKMLHVATPLESPVKLRTIRKTIARLATEMNSRKN